MKFTERDLTAFLDDLLDPEIKKSDITQICVTTGIDEKTMRILLNTDQSGTSSVGAIQKFQTLISNYLNGELEDKIKKILDKIPEFQTICAETVLIYLAESPSTPLNEVTEEKHLGFLSQYAKINPKVAASLFEELKYQLVEQIEAKLKACGEAIYFSPKDLKRYRSQLKNLQHRDVKDLKAFITEIDVDLVDKIAPELITEIHKKLPEILKASSNLDEIINLLKNSTEETIGQILEIGNPFTMTPRVLLEALENKAMKISTTINDQASKVIE